MLTWPILNLHKTTISFLFILMFRICGTSVRIWIHLGWQQSSVGPHFITNDSSGYWTWLKQLFLGVEYNSWIISSIKPWVSGVYLALLIVSNAMPRQNRNMLGSQFLSYLWTEWLFSLVWRPDCSSDAQCLYALVTAVICAVILRHTWLRLRTWGCSSDNIL